MAAPVPDPQSIALEQEAERQVTAELAAAVAVALELAGGALLAGSLAALSVAALTALQRQLQAAVRAIQTTPDMAPELRRYADRALELGTRQALRDMPRADRNRRPLLPPAAGLRELYNSVAGIDERARRNLDQLLTLAKFPINDDSILATASAAKHLENDARATTRWVTNRAVNLGTRRTAEARGFSVIWVAERDACLHCLAYAGQVAGPGEAFPGGLTFGDKPLSEEPIPDPPLHPNCRCRLKPYALHTEPAAVSLAHALEREARRSVVRGFSNYASTPARLRAAQRLLDSGASLPKSVVERARRDLARGQFSTRHRGSRVPAAGA
jgi:hypothetical protein